MCGTAVLFAGIMKWYWYGSGNREIWVLEMDSKSQLTLDRWRLQCTCFQTPVLNFGSCAKKAWGRMSALCRLYEKAGIHFPEIISIIWNKQGIFQFKMCLGYGGVKNKNCSGGKVEKVDDTFELIYARCGTVYAVTWQTTCSILKRFFYHNPDMLFHARVQSVTNCRGSIVVSCYSSCFSALLSS